MNDIIDNKHINKYDMLQLLKHKAIEEIKSQNDKGCVPSCENIFNTIRMTAIFHHETINDVDIKLLHNEICESYIGPGTMYKYGDWNSFCNNVRAKDMISTDEKYIMDNIHHISFYMHGECDTFEFPYDSITGRFIAPTK